MEEAWFNDEDLLIKMICDADLGKHLREMKGNTLALMIARFEKMTSI